MIGGYSAPHRENPSVLRREERGYKEWTGSSATYTAATEDSISPWVILLRQVFVPVRQLL